MIRPHWINGTIYANWTRNLSFDRRSDVIEADDAYPAHVVIKVSAAPKDNGNTCGEFGDLWPETLEALSRDQALLLRGSDALGDSSILVLPGFGFELFEVFQKRFEAKARQAWLESGNPPVDGEE